MNLVDVLKIKFPEADFLREIVVKDHGDGVLVLSDWNVPGVPKPTKADLNSWLKDTDIIDEYQNDVNRQLNEPLLERLKEIDISSIRPIREGDEEKLQQLETEAAALRAQLLPME